MFSYIRLHLNQCSGLRTGMMAKEMSDHPGGELCNHMKKMIYGVGESAWRERDE